jgi:hypothetical protein
MIFDVIKEAAHLVRQRKSEQMDAAERAAIAKAFNDRYTYRHQWMPNMPYLKGTCYGGMPRGGLAWMCPECNLIHHPTESSVFDGVHYPACCGIPEGNRLSHSIKTGA